jgi:hypothetical protein
MVNIKIFYRKDYLIFLAEDIEVKKRLLKI